MTAPVPPPVTDPEYLAQLRAGLEAARQQFESNHLVMPGITTARNYSQAVQRVITGHLESMAERLNCGHLCREMALVAVGGFGRNELGLHSDIDFCFITPEQATPEHEQFIKALLYPLWDLRLDLGYGVLSMRDCMEALGNDLTRTTSLLETRHLWGSQALAEELQERVHGKLHKHHTAWLFDSLATEQAARHKRHGDTVFLLEPDVKNSCGGLRDIHMLLWLAFALFGDSDVDVLVRNGLISPSERDRLMTAWSFLIDLRNTLHREHGRRIDKLTLERAVSVAVAMGRKQTESALPEEALMRAYYAHAGIVERLNRRLMHVARQRTPGQADEQPIVPNGNFLRQGRRIWIESREVATLKGDIWWPLKLFATAARDGLEPSEETVRHVEEVVPLVDDEARRSSILRDLFLAILRSTTGTLAANLRVMNRSGYLAALFPEYRPIRNLPRLDHYHQFTVDEHLIRAVGISEQLQGPTPPEGMGHVADVAREVLRVDLLNMALLFHDIGKGEGRAHVIRGAHSVKRIGERLNMRPIEQEVVRSLVANHQKMAHMALRRDLDDPALVKELAEAVRDPEDLKMLYVHSACDLRAVSEESWNDWRGRLMAMLFERTMDELRGRRSTAPARSAAGTQMEEIWQLLHQHPEGAAYTRADFDSFFSDMPERYRRSAPPADVVKHFLLSRKLDDKNRVLHRVDVYEGSSYVEVTFVARDSPGLFSKICGGLASRKCNILSAQIYTAASGECIDVFQVEPPMQLRDDLDRVLSTICRKVNDFVVNGKDPKWPRVDTRAALPITRERLDRRPPRVDIHNDMSPTHTVVEVRAPDRPGLLGDITAVFDRFSCNVDLAFISTESYQIVDVFYITDLETNKINEGGKLNSLCDALMHVIRPPAPAAS